MTSLEVQSDSCVSSDLLSLLTRLADTQPATALAIVRALEIPGRAGTPAPRELDGLIHRAMETLAAESRIDAEVDATVARATRAQEAFKSWPEERVDALLRDLAEAFSREAESFASATVEETGSGNVADKMLKNRFASLAVCESLVSRVGQGAVWSDSERRITELASPAGVVFGVVPVTGPVETAIFKTLIALKARNALILSFHHQAVGVGQIAAALIQDGLAAHGASRDLVQIPPRVGRKTTERFMRHPGVSLILATGGAGLVKAAYSSGKPAIGVGPGNAPAWICADANLAADSLD